MAKTVFNDHARERHGAYTKDGTILRLDAFIRTCLLREMQ